MNKEIEKLIQLKLIRDIQIKLVEAKIEGRIVNEDVINEILTYLEK